MTIRERIEDSKGEAFLQMVLQMGQPAKERHHGVGVVCPGDLFSAFIIGFLSYHALRELCAHVCSVVSFKR